MKRLFLVVLLVFVAGFSGQASSAALTIVASQWPPYVDQSMAKKGLAMEIVSSAFERAGYQPAIRIETWPRALEGLEIGIYDVVGTVWKTPEREKLFVFSTPYWINQIRFIKKKNLDVRYDNLDDLSGYVIGTIKDYAYGEEFVSSRTLIKIPQNHIIQNLSKLHEGDIDLTLGDEIAIRYELNQYMKGSISEFEFLEKPLATRELYIAVSKQNPRAEKIVSDFNRALLEMKGDGSFDVIAKKYQFPLLSE
jgi:polar amino acid transport system substrate-binding protein